MALTELQKSLADMPSQETVRQSHFTVHPQNKNIAISAATAHNFEQIKAYVLSGGDINICDEDGSSLLTDFVSSYLEKLTPEEDEACSKHPEYDYAFWDYFVPEYLFIPLEQRESGIKEKLDFFFEHGADPNLCVMVDGATETALSCAVTDQDYYLTKYLLEHGADPAIHLFEDTTVESIDGKEYWLMDHLDFYIMDGDKGKQAQIVLAIAQLLWEYGLKNWRGYCIDIDPETGVTGCHPLQPKY